MISEKTVFEMLAMLSGKNTCLGVHVCCFCFNLLNNIIYLLLFYYFVLFFIFIMFRIDLIPKNTYIHSTYIENLLFLYCLLYFCYSFKYVFLLILCILFFQDSFLLCLLLLLKKRISFVGAFVFSPFLFFVWINKIYVKDEMSD